MKSNLQYNFQKSCGPIVKELRALETLLAD